MDANAPYHDNFVNKRADQKAYDIATDKALADQIAAVQQRRCAACRKPAEVTRLDWIDLRQPERTLFLRAPLSKAAGGTQACKEPVYQDITDPDYQSVRELMTAAARKAWQSPRRDLHALIGQPLAAAPPSTTR